MAGLYVKNINKNYEVDFETFLEGCSRITSPSAITETKVDPKERMSHIVATSGGSQENILNGVIQLKQDQFLANLTSLRSDLMQISNRLEKNAVFVPVKHYATCLTGDEEITFGQV